MSSDNSATDTTTDNTASGSRNLLHLNSLQELDELLENESESLIRKGNVILVGDSTDTDDDIGVCRLDYMVSLSALLPPDGGGIRVPANQLFGVNGFAAVALAAQHLNAGDGTVVPEVEDLTRGATSDLQSKRWMPSLIKSWPWIR